jgi:hypothetical protein
MSLRASDLSREYGFTARHWIRLAAAGRIPGAHQPSGHGGGWLFDRQAFVAWWRSTQHEVSTWPGYTEGAASTGVAPSVKAESTGEASKQRIERLLADVLGHGSTSSTRSRGATSRGAHSRKRPSALSGST